MNTVDSLRGWVETLPDNRCDARERCQALLADCSRCMSSAIQIWEQAVAADSAETDRFKFLLWVGTERAKQLHRLNLELRRLANELTQLTGIACDDSFGPCDELTVVDAYRQLDTEQTPVAYAEAAIEVIAVRRDSLETLTDRR